MDKKTYQGELAEASVIKELIKQNWFPFDDVTGKAPFDVIATQGDQLRKIAIRSSSVFKKDRNNYTIQIASIRGNGKRVVDIDRNLIDILAVYLMVHDVVCFVPLNLLINIKRNFTIYTEVPKHKSPYLQIQLIMSDLLKIK